MQLIKASKIEQPSYKFAAWAQAIQPGIMQKMLEVSANSNIISFSLGLPDPNLFPLLEYQHSMNTVSQSTPKVFQYSPVGFKLKKQIVKLMESRNIKCRESQVFITAGAQQAVSLLARLFLNMGSSLITEDLTYPGFLQVVAPYMPNIITIPACFQKGPCLTSLEAKLADKSNKPAFIYLIPEGHNPLGFSLSQKHKQQLADLARFYQVPIIEDDAYGFLSYDKLTAPIRAYEDRWVFYVGTFSKIIAPSLRVGWLIVPEEIIPALSYAKEAADINTVTFSQHFIADYLEKNNINEHLTKLKRAYKARRDIMVKAVECYFPKGTKLSDSKHGFFLWVKLTGNLNTTNIFHQAIENNIVFMPGEVFIQSPHPFARKSMRLNFSHSNNSLIEQGIETLGRIIRNSTKIKSKSSDVSWN